MVPLASRVLNGSLLPVQHFDEVSKLNQLEPTLLFVEVKPYLRDILRYPITFLFEFLKFPTQISKVKISPLIDE